jgi:hypothetical protein
MTGGPSHCRRSRRSKIDRRGRIGEVPEDVIGVVGFTRKTITKWLWFVKRNVTLF